MSEWKEYKLGDCIEVINGYAFKSANFLDEKTETALPILKIRNVANGDANLNGVQFHEYDNSLAKFVVLKGDVLLALTGNHPQAMTQVVGEASRYKLIEKALLNQRVAKIKPKEELINDYLYYFLKDDSTHDFLANQSSGSANQANISKNDIENIPIQLPPLSEQLIIASVLSSLDDKIDLLHRQNATLETMAETLFRQWFVVPIKKAESEGTFAAGFKNEKFGLWIKETVGGDWGQENPEGDFTKAVNCIRGTDIADLNVGLPERTPIRFVKEKKFENIEPKEGDLIIEISGGTETQSTGRTTYINSDIKSLFNYPFVFSNFCRMLRVKKAEYSFFVYSYLQYLYNQDEYFNLENGSSGIKNLNYKALLFELDYPMPTEARVLDFHKEVKALFKKINQNKIQIRTLTALRDTLLPKLMSGEVRVIN